jgi:glucose dehydrogenase
VGPASRTARTCAAGTAVAPGQPQPQLLYANSTLAFNLDTGKLKCFYSHLPNDT